MSGWRKRKILEHYKESLDADYVFLKTRPITGFIYVAGMVGLIWKILYELFN